MTLFFDESIGTGVPQALRLVGYSDIVYLRQHYARLLQGVSRIEDVRWLPEAGERTWLAVTEDLRILRNEHERRLISEHSVGIVFLTSARERRAPVLEYMLKRMDWFEAIDSEPRPFAYVTTLRGRPRRVEL